MLRVLNLQRELWRSGVSRPVVLWLPDKCLELIAQGAPDFWSWRSGIFRLPIVVPIPVQRAAGFDRSLDAWRKKLDYLQWQEGRVDDPGQRFALAEQIKEAKAKIGELEVTAGIQQAFTPSAFNGDISRIIKYAPAELIGREAETKILSDAWDKVVRGEERRPHVLTFVALGGEGKTSLVAKWAADLAFQDWPGCDAAFAWSFYSQGTREQMASSSDLFLAEALSFFGDAAMAGSAQGAFDKGRRLAQLAGERRALLILDGLEPLQYAPTSPTPGELKDQGLAALLKGLAATSHGLCVVTTRYAIPDLRAFVGKSVREEKLTRLSMDAGVALLQKLGVKGRPREVAMLVEDVRGHALTLGLLGAYLRDAHGGDIRKRDLVKLAEADAEEQGGHAFRVMDAYARSLANEGERGQRALALLSLLGLFDRPASADCLAALLEAPAISGLTDPLLDLTEAQGMMAITRLETASLVTINRDARLLASTSPQVAGSDFETQSPIARLIGSTSLDTHPLLREYFAGRVRQQQPLAWRTGHRRLYEHLCKTTFDKPKPTLEDLQPLYQAVAHGCQAGLQQEALNKVYRARIQRTPEYYSARELGAFGSDLGAIACFFEIPWSRVAPVLREPDQAWLLSNAASYLRALGRLTEALEPMRSGLEMSIKQEGWHYAAILASNLSELELTLGEVAGAVGNAEQSVTYADRNNDAFQRLSKRCTHADALHQADRRAEAEARFREAEQMQAESQPVYPLLYSLQGFRYCDLLLTEAERAAWQKVVQGFSPTAATQAQPDDTPREEPPPDGLKPETILAALRAVSERAAQTLKWVEAARMDILSIALDHLTLGRAALYAAILGNFDLRTSPLEIDNAVSGLRRAGLRQYLPLGLFTRAWQRSLTGARTGPESAQSDLDEAWEIAERGPMKLHMADIHLYRARLFFREQSYPWKSPQDDLAAAEQLINACGYHRRDEELADAKQAIPG